MVRKIKKFIAVFGLILLMPVLVSAQLNSTKGLITAVGNIVSQLLIVASGIALLVFFWGLVRFLWKTGSEADHEQGRNIMIWGIVAMFVMISVWGIVGFMQKELGLPNTITPSGTPIPTGIQSPCGGPCLGGSASG